MKSITIAILSSFFLLLVGCDNRESDDRLKIMAAEIEAKEKAAEAEERKNRPIITACQQATQRLLDSLGNGSKVLDWVGLNSSTVDGYVLPTATGFSYEIGAKVSGQQRTLAIACYTDKNSNVIDLQTYWDY